MGLNGKKIKIFYKNSWFWDTLNVYILKTE